MEYLGHRLGQPLVPLRQGLRVNGRELPPVLLQRLRVADPGEGHVRREHVQIKGPAAGGEIALVSAGRPVELPEQLVQPAAEIGPRLGDGLLAAGLTAAFLGLTPFSCRSRERTLEKLDFIVSLSTSFS